MTHPLFACSGLARRSWPRSRPTAAHAQDSLFQQGRGMLEGVLQGQSGGGEPERGPDRRRPARGAPGRHRAGHRQLGQVDGFNTNPDVHIPLPQSSQTVQSALAMVGMSGVADDLELRMNRAAETAVPQAKELFWQAVSEMTLEDAQGILAGPTTPRPLLPGQDDRTADRALHAGGQCRAGRCRRGPGLRPDDGRLRGAAVRARRRGQPHALRRASRRWTACS